MKLAGPQTQVIDVVGRRVIPGLMDSHTDPIRGVSTTTWNYAGTAYPPLPRRCACCASRRDGPRRPQWVRVVGGFTEWQFSERRLPTLAELNEAAPDTPVFVLHLYDRALLNRAAVRAVGYTKDTPEPTGGQIERDKAGNPTDLLIARPNASILYSTLARGPKLPREHQLVSTRYFMRELISLFRIQAGGPQQEVWKASNSAC